MKWFLCAAWLLSAVASAELAPAKGRLLVSTEVVGGDLFAETVILLLEYGESGAMGLVVNRPTEVGLDELLDDAEAITDRSQTVYWGGPVEMDTLSALAQSSAPLDSADEIVTSVYRLPFDDALEHDSTRVRFYLGYAGWAAGQLDYELTRGSWHVLPASAETVFADDPTGLWQRLKPAQEYRAEVQPMTHAAGSRRFETSGRRIAPCLE